MSFPDVAGYALAGLAVGFAVGATGVGGGSLMTPLLVVGFGVNALTAVGTDLLYATACKVFAVVLHGRNRSVDWRIVGLLARGSVPTAVATIFVLHHVSDRALLSRWVSLVLAGAVLVTAAAMLLGEPLARRLGRKRARTDAPHAHDARVATVAAGALIGVLITMSSVGAGVVGMLFLLWLHPKLPPIRLVGSDLAHSAAIAAIAGVGHVRLGNVDYGMLGALVCGGLPGIVLGSRLGFRMQALALRRSVAVMLLIAGATTLTKSLSQ